jgi:hypothetical protein
VPPSLPGSLNETSQPQTDVLEILSSGDTSPAAGTRTQFSQTDTVWSSDENPWDQHRWEGVSDVYKCMWGVEDSTGRWVMGVGPIQHWEPRGKVRYQYSRETNTSQVIHTDNHEVFLLRWRVGQEQSGYSEQGRM